MTGYGNLPFVLAICCVLVTAGCILPRTNPVTADEAVLIALNDSRVLSDIGTHEYTVNPPQREHIGTGNDLHAEFWNVQIWMPDRVDIIIVEVADDGSLAGIRQGHNPPWKHK